MRRATRLSVALLAFAPLLAVACSSDGALARSRKDRMLASAPAGYNVQLITVRVTDRQYGRLTVEQTIVELLQRREGILDVQRGAGREELYLLAETFVDPYALPYTAPDRYIVRVVDVETADTNRELVPTRSR